jgi:hypothetical protein
VDHLHIVREDVYKWLKCFLVLVSPNVRVMQEIMVECLWCILFLQLLLLPLKLSVWRFVLPLALWPLYRNHWSSFVRTMEPWNPSSKPCQNLILRYVWTIEHPVAPRRFFDVVLMSLLHCVQKYMADVLSILAMTMAIKGERVSAWCY